MEQTHGSWGNRLRTFQWDGGIVTLLYLQSNKRCSWHKHLTSYNKFTCISGKVVIKTDKGYSTTLTEKQEFTVEPGVMHEFQTLDEPAIVEEIAYTKYTEYDIQRERLGGPMVAEESGTFYACCGALYSTEHKEGCKHKLGGPMNV